MISSLRIIGNSVNHGFIKVPHKTRLLSKLFHQSSSFQLSNHLRFSNFHYYSTHNYTPHAPTCKELEIPIIGGKIAAKAWGSEECYPVIAFHGWLDNCGTFDKLIPLLSDKYYFVAIDAPGHGRSSHKPIGCVYTDTSMIMDFKYAIDSLGWTKFHVMGHSMGAALAVLFSSIFPDLVEKLILLDGVKPYSVPEDTVPSLKFQSIKEYIKCEKKLSNPPPIYTPESAAKRLKKGMHYEVNDEGIEILLKRGTKMSDCGTGLVFSRDLRCRPIEPLSVRCHDTTEQMIMALKCELLIILATNTHPNYQPESPETISKFLKIYEKRLKHFVLTHVEGNHFVHLNNPERLAPIINEFLSTDKK